MIFYKTIFHKLFDCFGVLKYIPSDLKIAFKIDEILKSKQELKSVAILYCSEPPIIALFFDDFLRVIR